MECTLISMECQKVLWSALWSVHKSLWSETGCLWSVTKFSMECQITLWSVTITYALLNKQVKGTVASMHLIPRFPYLNPTPPPVFSFTCSYVLGFVLGLWAGVLEVSFRAKWRLTSRKSSFTLLSQSAGGRVNHQKIHIQGSKSVGEALSEHLNQ